MELIETRPAVMLTGGVGLTPFKCMLEHAAVNQIDTEVRDARMVVASLAFNV